MQVIAPVGTLAQEWKQPGGVGCSKNVSSVHSTLTFIEEDAILMQAALAALRGRVHKRILVGDIVTSHRIKQLHSLRLLEKYAAWQKTNDFDRMYGWKDNAELGGVCI